MATALLSSLDMNRTAQLSRLAVQSLHSMATELESAGPGQLLTSATIMEFVGVHTSPELGPRAIMDLIDEIHHPDAPMASIDHAVLHAAIDEAIQTLEFDARGCRWCGATGRGAGSAKCLLSEP